MSIERQARIGHSNGFWRPTPAAHPQPPPLANPPQHPLKPRMPEREIPSISSMCRPWCSVPRSTGTESLSDCAFVCRRADNASSLMQAYRL